MKKILGTLIPALALAACGGVETAPADGMQPGTDAIAAAPGTLSLAATATEAKGS